MCVVRRWCVCGAGVAWMRGGSGAAAVHTGLPGYAVSPRIRMLYLVSTQPPGYACMHAWPRCGACLRVRGYVLLYAGRGDTGSWIQIIDEPNWTDNATLTNTIAMMKLYRSIDPRVKVYQTRWPEGPGVLASSAQEPQEVAMVQRQALRGVVGRQLATSPEAQVLPPSYAPLLDLVDWWCPHVCQWSTAGVPDAIALVRKQRLAAGRPFHATVYDNGVPIIEAAWERERSQALDVWASNGTLDGTVRTLHASTLAAQMLHLSRIWQHAQNPPVLTNTG